MRSGDTVYTIYELVSPARFGQHDALIREVAAQHRVDPMLIKAIIWRESRFDARKVGGAGERGLMQLTEGAASEWVRENRVQNFQVEELFDPKVNVQAGTWYLARAIGRWKQQSIRCRSRWRNTTPARAARSVGPVAPLP
jgi:soluble lytic murein transglycosylase